MLLAPREVCASAVSAADPANSNAIARVSETLRISFLLKFAGCAPLGSAETAHFTELGLLVHANRGFSVSLEFDLSAASSRSHF
jgi:hypothetical protein